MYEISYANAIMYSHVVPMPGDDEKNDDAPLYDDSKDGCNDIDLTGDDDDEIIIKSR